MQHKVTNINHRSWKSYEIRLRVAIVASTAMPPQKERLKVLQYQPDIYTNTEIRKVATPQPRQRNSELQFVGKD